MEKINLICRHPLWKDCVAQIAELEEKRTFCKHDVGHFMDVARIAYIENLEKHLLIPKEWIYAAALLHDIGRHLQYREGIPHDQGGAEIAAVILADCGFEENVQQEILSAISQHRIQETKENDTLAGLLYRADKASRMCLFCHACKTCNWSPEKKNMVLDR